MHVPMKTRPLDKKRILWPNHSYTSQLCWVLSRPFLTSCLHISCGQELKTSGGRRRLSGWCSIHSAHVILLGNDSWFRHAARVRCNFRAWLQFLPKNDGHLQRLRAMTFSNLYTVQKKSGISLISTKVIFSLWFY